MTQLINTFSGAVAALILKSAWDWGRKEYHKKLIVKYLTQNTSKDGKFKWLSPNRIASGVGLSPSRVSDVASSSKKIRRSQSDNEVYGLKKIIGE